MIIRHSKALHKDATVSLLANKVIDSRNRTEQVVNITIGYDIDSKDITIPLYTWNQSGKIIAITSIVMQEPNGNINNSNNGYLTLDSQQDAILWNITKSMGLISSGLKIIIRFITGIE